MSTPGEINALSILTRARELIATPEAWTKGALARDSVGVMVSTVGSRACCFCAAGACFRAAAEFTGMTREDTTGTPRVAFEVTAVQDALDHLEIAALRATGVPRRTTVSFNDHAERTHAEVLAVFDCAIKLAGGAS